MHNGELPAFAAFKRKLLLDLPEHLFNLIQGHTDSECCFMVFLWKLESDVGPLQETVSYTEQQLLKAMRATLIYLQSLCDGVNDSRAVLNIVVSDGDTVIASRYAGPKSAHASLYYASGSGWEPVEGNPGEYHMAQDDRRAWAHIIASEPLTNDSHDWVKIPPNSFCIITASSDLLIEPIDPVVEE